MTSALIPPVIPRRSAPGNRPRGRPGAAGPLPLPASPGQAPALAADVVYGLGRIDASGRVADMPAPRAASVGASAAPMARARQMSLISGTMNASSVPRPMASGSPMPSSRRHSLRSVRSGCNPIREASENSTRTKGGLGQDLHHFAAGRAALHHLAAGRYSTAAQLIAVVVFAVIEFLPPMGPRGSPGGHGSPQSQQMMSSVLV
jgi:hypothetical protein